MNQYEVAILYDPGLEVDSQAATDRVEKIFLDNGGKIVNIDNWGKRKLAYPINKQETALYVFYTLELPNESVQKIENTLNITDEVIRFLITKPDLKAMAKAQKAKRTAQSDDETEAGVDENKDDENAHA